MMCDNELAGLNIAIWSVVGLVVLAIIATTFAIGANGGVIGALSGAATIAMGAAVASIVAALAAMGVAIGYALAFDKCIASQNALCSGAFSNARAEMAAIEALLLVQLYGSLAALGVSWIPVIGVPPMVTVLIALFGISALLFAWFPTWNSYLNCVNPG